MVDKKAVRKPIAKSLRFEVFKRDSFKCQYCGACAPDVLLHLDHIKPVFEGGDDDITNLITSCQGCNLGKSKNPLSANAAVEKSRNQLEILQERREQLELMMEWQRGLSDLDSIKADEVARYWTECVPSYALNEKGLIELRKRLNRYSVEELLIAMRSAVNSYLWFDDDNKIIPSSVQKTWEMVSKIASINRKTAGNPDLKELYFIRADCRKQCPYYFRDKDAMEWLEACLSWGITIAELRSESDRVRNWTDFESRMISLITEAKRKAGE